MKPAIANPDAVTAFNLFRVPDRIAIIHAIRQHGAPMSRETLAAHVADWGDDRPPGDDISSAARRWTLTLQHVHLPRLVDAGIIEYDPETKTITALDEDRLDALLATGQETLAALQGVRSPPA